MSLALAAALLTIGLCEADAGGVRSGALGLGLGVREIDDGLVVACVVPGSAADAAELEVGQRILAVSGQRVRSIRALAEQLARGKPGARLDLQLGRDVPLLRFGLIATGGLLTGQADTMFGTVGAFASHRVFDDRFAFVLTAHYAAVGYEPNVGRNVLGIHAGLDAELPIGGALGLFGRALIGPNLAVGPGFLWEIEPVGAVAHLGARWGPAELFATMGLGPAEGFNMGIGVAVGLGLGSSADELLVEGGPLELL